MIQFFVVHFRGKLFFACCVNSASFRWGFQMTSKLILNRTRVGKMTCQFISKPFFMYKLNLNFGSEITLSSTTNKKEKKSSWMTNYFVIRKWGDLIWWKSSPAWAKVDNQRIELSCLLRCKAKWSDLENARSHIRHWNGLSPVCFLICLVNSSDLANFHPQSFQLQM